MWQHSCMNLDKAIRSLEEEEKVIVENIKKGRRPVTSVGNAEAGTSHGRRDANGSQHTAGPSNSITLFGTSISYSENDQTTEANRKRDSSSTKIVLPPTFMAFPTPPVGIPQTVYGLRSSLGSTATAFSSSGKRTIRLSSGEPSAVGPTSPYPVAPRPVVAPAPVRLDRGKQPMQAGASSSSVGGRREPNRRHNRKNTGR